MNFLTAMNFENFRGFLQNSAFDAAYQLRLRYPDLKISLYQLGDSFYLKICNAIENYEALEKEFREEIKPLAYPIHLVCSVPPGAVFLSRDVDYKAELWLKGYAVAVGEISKLLSLAHPKIPSGQVEYQRETGTWSFRTSIPLTDEEIEAVREGAKSIGLDGPIVIETLETSSREGQHRGLGDGLALVPASTYRHVQGQAIRALVEEDDEHWRKFLAQRSQRQEPPVQPQQTKHFSCLFNLGDQSELRLSELLTLYDHVHLLPAPTFDIEWTTRHGLEMREIQELVSLGRISFVLPSPAARYSPHLLNAVYEANPAAVVMSRKLLSASLLQAERKNPLLYGPFNSEERVLMLGLMSKILTTDWARATISYYQQAFSNQHAMYMGRGAMGLLSHGIGPMVGHILHEVKKQDARLELGINGASIEWALGLGASYIPTQYGPDFDETRNSLFIASFLGSRPVRNADPLANRMHSVTTGLLAAHDIPPIEVARNFKSDAVHRFRSVAMRLMYETTTQEELNIAITALNQEVVALESRKERLAKFKLNHLGSKVVGGTIGAAIDPVTFPFASVLADWMFQMLKGRLSDEVNSRIDEMGAILTGLLAGKSIDAVIVSRARQQI